MWEPLQGLLSSPLDGVKVQALWVIGTALQNNPSAQRAYLTLDPLQKLLEYLSPSSRAPAQLRSKAIYALSGLLKHHTAALVPFDAAGGWAAFRSAISDSDIGVRRKTAFLLNTLLFSPSTSTLGADTDSETARVVHPNSHAALVADPRSADTAPATLRALRAHGLIPALVRELTVPTPYGPDGEEGGACDADLEEKLARLLHTYVAVHGGTFDAPEKHSLKVFLDTKRAGVQGEGGGELGLDADELRVFESALA